MDTRVSQHKAEIERLCRTFSVRRLEIFGSAARGLLRANSDLDFLVEFGPVARGEYADAYFGLHEGLEGIFGRSVDLVIASAIENPYFRQSVDESKALLYAA